MINRFCFFSLVLVGLLSGVLAKAQNTYMLALDKPLYVLGDRLSYAVLATPDVLPKGAVVEAVIFDDKGAVVYRQFAFAKTAAGLIDALQIPYDLSQGVYRLVIYGLGEKATQPTEVARALVPIYDDLNKANFAAIQSNDEQPYLLAAKELGALVDFSFPLSLKPPSGTREDGILSDLSSQGPTLVSILDSGLYPENWPILYQGKTTGEVLGKELWMKGVWRDEGGAFVASNLLGAFKTRHGSFSFTKSNAVGEFLLRLNGFSGAQDIQFAESGLPPRKVKRAEEQLPPLSVMLPAYPGLAALLEASLARKSIYAMYGVESASTIEVNKQQLAATQAGNVAVAVDDYSAFPDFATFAYEIFGTASRWRPVKKGYYVSVYNRSAKEYFKEAPLLIVDGYITKDIAAISALPTSKLDSVHVYGDPDLLRKYYPALGQWGVIRITSKQGESTTDFRNPQTTVLLQGFASEVVTSQREEELPWLFPSIMFQFADQAGLRYKHTDDKSEFVVRSISLEAPGGVQLSRGSYSIR